MEKMKNNIIELANAVSSGNKKIDDLTEVEKKDLYNFLKVNLIKKEIKLKNLKNEIIYNQLEDNSDIETALNAMSAKDKENFINYLNNKIYK